MKLKSEGYGEYPHPFHIEVLPAGGHMYAGPLNFVLAFTIVLKLLNFTVELMQVTKSPM